MTHATEARGDKAPDRARLRLIWLMASGVLLMAVAAASALALVMSLVLSKDLPFESDGEAVMRILKEGRGAGAAGDDAGESAPRLALPAAHTPDADSDASPSAAATKEP